MNEYICCIGLSTLQSPVVTIFTIRFDAKQCYTVLNGTCKVCERSDVVGSQNTGTAKRRVCRQWNGVTLHVLEFVKNWEIEFGCHSKERNRKKRKSGSSVVEYSSSLVNMLAVFDIWSVNLQSWLKAFLVLLFVGAANQTKPTLCPFMPSSVVTLPFVLYQK